MATKRGENFKPEIPKLETPLVEKYRAEKKAETLAKRVTAKTKIGALQKEGKVLFPLLQQKVDEIKKTLGALEEERKGLQNELSKAVADLQRQKLRVENEIRKNDEILFNSYNEKIDEALVFFKDKLDELRKPGKIDKRTRGGETNLITMKREFKTETNVDAIRKAMTYCQAVIRELEEMRLNPELDLLRIETLKKNIPSIDIYQETIGGRTLRGAEDVNPKLMRK
jgi:hypothetical protein